MTKRTGIEEERLIVNPACKPKYKLEELLADCDPSVPMTEEDCAWLDAPPKGREAF